MTTKVARRRKVKPTDPRQGNLLSLLLRDEGPEMVPLPSEIVPVARGFSEDQRVRGLLNEAFRGSGRSRDELAAAMNTGDEPVSAAMLNTWTGSGRSNAAPLKHLKALLKAIGTKVGFEFLNELLAGSGFVVLDETWAGYARIGQMVVMRGALEERIREAATARGPVWGRP